MAEKNDKSLYAASMADLAKWDAENPHSVVAIEAEIYLWPQFLFCDECGKPADTIHFLDEEDRYPKPGSVTVKFACPEHDFGDYWVDVDRFVNPQERFGSH